MRRGLALAMTSAALVGGGCSALVDISGLSGGGGTHDGGLDGASVDADAGSDAPTDAVLEAGSDGSGAEAGADAALRFCQLQSPAPLFCDDFDVPPLGALWDKLNAAGGGTGKLDTAQFHSPPNSFLVTIPPLATGASAEADLLKAFTVSFTDATLDFWFFSTAYTDDQFASIGLASGRSYGLITGSNIAQLMEELPNGQMIYTTLFYTPPTGSWTHVIFTLHVGASDAGFDSWVSVSFDTNVAVNQAPVGATHADGAPNIGIGAVYVQNSPSGWQGRYDDVVFTVK